MREGDTVRVDDLTDVLDRVKTRELEPLSFSEAKALVILLGGSSNMGPLSPGAGLLPRKFQRTPLQELFASLPPTQRQAFNEGMYRACLPWPRKKRQKHKEYAKNWDDAWAAALSAASHTGETAMSMSIAMRRARDVDR